MKTVRNGPDVPDLDHPALERFCVGMPSNRPRKWAGFQIRRRFGTPLRQSRVLPGIRNLDPKKPELVKPRSPQSVTSSLNMPNRELAFRDPLDRSPRMDSFFIPATFSEANGLLRHRTIPPSNSPTAEHVRVRVRAALIGA